MKDYSSLSNYTRVAVLVCYYGLLLLLTIAAFTGFPDGGSPNVVRWFLSILPLLIFIRGLTKGEPRTHIWLCFVILLYFCISVTQQFSPDAGPMDALELVLIVGLFLASMLFVRWRSRALFQQQESRQE